MSHGFSWMILCQGVSQDVPSSVATEDVLFCSFGLSCEVGPSFRRVQSLHCRLLASGRGMHLGNSSPSPPSFSFPLLRCIFDWLGCPFSRSHSDRSHVLQGEGASQKCSWDEGCSTCLERLPSQDSWGVGPFHEQQCQSGDLSRGTVSRLMCSLTQEIVASAKEHFSGPVKPSRSGPCHWVVTYSMDIRYHLWGAQSSSLGLVC